MAEISRRSRERDMSLDSDVSDMPEEEVVESPSKRSSKARSTPRGKAARIAPGDLMAKIVPVLFKLEELFEHAVEIGTPWMEKAIEAYEKFHKQLEPYGPDQIVQMLTGLGMMFFGGFFITSVAVFEAMSQGGREDLVKNIGKLREQIRQVREANERDDELDEDNDGVADVDQISKAELGQRKLLVFLSACDPEVVASSLGNMYTILMAVTATLQVKFARSVSLGAAIGNVLAKTTLKFAVPPLKQVTPEEFHKWIPPVASYVCRFIGVSIAFFVQRILSTVHTALRGARLATDGFTQWCEARDLNYLSDGYMDDAFAFLLAAIGIWGQLFVWSRLPFLIKLLMFPATFTEWILSTLVSLQVSRGTSTPGQAASFNAEKMPAGVAAAGMPA